MVYSMSIAILLIVSFLFNVYFIIRPIKHDGEIVVIKTNSRTTFSLELDKDPDEIVDMDIVVFKVRRESSEYEDVDE